MTDDDKVKAVVLEVVSSSLEVYFEVKVNKILVDRIGSLVRIIECSNLTAKFWT